MYLTYIKTSLIYQHTNNSPKGQRRSTMYTVSYKHLKTGKRGTVEVDNPQIYIESPYIEVTAVTPTEVN